MITSYQIREPSKGIRRLQNFCGLLFGFVFLTNVICMSLMRMHILSPSQTWYLYILGSCSVLGFCILTYLSSDLVSEIFAGSMIAVEVLYSLFLPTMMPRMFDDMMYFELLLYGCVSFCIFSIYLWTTLMANHNFGKDMKWIVFLPLTYLINLCVYWGELSQAEGISRPLSISLFSTDIAQTIVGIVLLYMMVGYWKLCHARCFSREDDMSMRTSMSPFNRYTLVYAVLVAAAMCLF